MPAPVLISGGNAEWIELDLNGNLLERSRVDGTVRKVVLAAFTADDHVYLDGNRGELYTFRSRAHCLWEPTARAWCTCSGPQGRSSWNGSIRLSNSLDMRLSGALQRDRENAAGSRMSLYRNLRNCSKGI